MVDLNKFVQENIKKIQKNDITNITRHKIDYISDYVYNWTIVGVSIDI